MAIRHFGDEGFEVNVESPQEVLTALDLMHTQVIDNLGQTSPLLEILEEAMDRVEGEFPEVRRV